MRYAVVNGVGRIISGHERDTRAARRALLAVLQRGVTATEIAARLRVSHASVSRWASGANAPSARCAFDLEQYFGIEADAWKGGRRR